MSYGEKKPALSLLIGVGKGHKEPEGSEEEERGESASDQSGEMKDLAQAFIDAVGDKDAERVAAAFQAMCEECMKDM